MDYVLGELTALPIYSDIWISNNYGIYAVYFSLKHKQITRLCIEPRQLCEDCEGLGIHEKSTLNS